MSGAQPAPASWPAPPETLNQAVERAARHFAHRGINMLDNRGRVQERRDYAQLRDSLLLAARRYTALGLRPGDRVLVCLPTSWSFIEAWLGAQLAGGLPVAIAPPGAIGSHAGQIERALSVAALLGARFVLTSASFVEQAGKLQAPPSTIALITPEQLAATAPSSRLVAPAPRGDELAFLQLTSGSTGTPRAVMVPHSAIVHNVIAASEAIGRPLGAPTHAWAQTMVSWLPLYHDMGLVGGLIYGLLNGIDVTLIAPRTFLARPWVWLEATARAGACVSPAPNFAYQLCVERAAAAKIEGIDLSQWTAAMTGSEMVRPETMTAFCERFAPLGLKPEAARSCYGMAEATVAVTLDVAGQGIRTRPLPKDADSGLGLREVASTGPPVLDTRVEISGPDGRARRPGQIGEVRVQGPGVCQGYWNDETATREVFRDGWLYTGDLGFLDRDGELYLTGRTKEILILRGQNVMPHDLEWIAEGTSGGGGSFRSGAFSVARDATGEQAVVVLEANERDGDTLADLRHEVASRIGRRLGLPLADVVLVRRGTIPKTSSGKIQRRALRQLYLSGELERLEP